MSRSRTWRRPRTPFLSKKPPRSVPTSATVTPHARLADEPVEPLDSYAADTDQPLLVVGTTHDPATCTALIRRPWSTSSATLGPDQRRLGPHTAYVSGDSCIKDAVDTYLVSGAVLTRAPRAVARIATSPGSLVRCQRWRDSTPRARPCTRTRGSCIEITWLEPPVAPARSVPSGPDRHTAGTGGVGIRTRKSPHVPCRGEVPAANTVGRISPARSTTWPSDPPRVFPVLTVALSRFRSSARPQVPLEYGAASGLADDTTVAPVAVLRSSCSRTHLQIAGLARARMPVVPSGASW